MHNEYFYASFADLDLSISKPVHDIWHEYRQINNKDTEACGILIGTKDLHSNHYWIDSTTVPMPKDIRRKYSFIMKDPYHQQAVDKAYVNSNGVCIYLGTWHTHPQTIPIPSHIDYQDWHKCIQRNPDRDLFFIIIGTEQIKIFIYMNNKFIDYVLPSKN